MKNFVAATLLWSYSFLAFRVCRCQAFQSSRLVTISLNTRERNTALTAIGNPYLLSLEKKTSEIERSTTVEPKNPYIKREKNYLPSFGEKDKGKEKENLIQKIKDAGPAGIVAFGLVQVAFWGSSVPVVVLGHTALTGHFPDFANEADKAQLGAEAFAYINIVRFAIPIKIGVALSITPWIQENVIERFK